MTDYLQQPSGVVLISEYFDISFFNDDQFASSIVLAKNTQQDLDINWQVGGVDERGDFAAFWELFQQERADFSATACIKQTVQAGVVGVTLSGDSNFPIGFLPHCSVSGYEVTETPNVSFTSTVLDQSTPPAQLSWTMGFSEGGRKGNIEWARVKISYTYDDAPTAPGNQEVRQFLYKRDLDASLSGVYYRTNVLPLEIDGSISGNFAAIGSGTYQLVAEVKQSCNPSPYVICSGFTVGTADVYSIGASGIPASGTRDIQIAFTSARTDSRTEQTQKVYWDFGNYTMWGNNTDTYRNPSYTFTRQGYYNPIVTYVLDNGYILSKALPKVF